MTPPNASMGGAAPCTARLRHPGALPGGRAAYSFFSKLSKATVRKMKQNLAWASVYNLLAIPVAAGVFYNSLGWSLRPEVSALLMSASSIIVALNAVSLRRAKV